MLLISNSLLHWELYLILSLFRWKISALKIKGKPRYGHEKAMMAPSLPLGTHYQLYLTPELQPHCFLVPCVLCSFVPQGFGMLLFLLSGLFPLPSIPHLLCLLHSYTSQITYQILPIWEGFPDPQPRIKIPVTHFNKYPSWLQSIHLLWFKIMHLNGYFHH